MPYIGNTVQNQGFSPAVDYFDGDGTTVTFTLSRPVASVAQLTAVIENVIQNPSTAFNVSGNDITFTSAPPAGTNNIWVEYTSLVTTYAAISQDPSVIGDITATGGYLAEGDFGNSFIDGTIVDYVSGNARITTGPSDAMTFYNGGTSSRTALMTLGATGNVGIGTSSPDYNLQVEGSGDRAVAITSTTSGDCRLWLGDTAAPFNGAVIYRNDSDSLAFNTVATERMRINSSGNVGIGTSSPSSTLHLSSTLPILTFTDTDDSATTRIYQDNANFVIEVDGTDTKASSSLKFQVDNTVRMTIDSAGRVTTPGQPAFRANRTTSYTTSSNVFYEVFFDSLQN
jgi:hypothetical protein